MGTEFVDHIAVALATAPSRRQIIMGLAASAYGGIGSFLGQERTRAQGCKANGKACKKNGQCCSNTCVGGSGTGSTAHSAGVCQPATGCDAPKTLCGTTCVDLATDPANCGSCGNPCVSGACQNRECCVTGTCGSLTCPATADSCTGTGLSCGSGSISCYCHVVPVATGGTASVCGSRTGCQQCTVGQTCTYSIDENNIPTTGTCISCGGCPSCFLTCSA